MDYLQIKFIMKGIKSNEFYQKIIDRNNEFIKENKKLLDEIKNNPEMKTQSSILAYFIWHLNNIIASYSKGDTKDELQKQFSETIVVMEKVWNKKATKVFHGRQQEEYDQYRLQPHINMLQMLSLAVLLDVPEDEFNILVTLIDRDNIKDFLIEFIISSKIKNRKPLTEEGYNRYLIIPQLYKKLVDIANTESKSEAESKIKDFLKKYWIKIPKKNALNLNLKDIPNYEVSSGFVGLWAFEVAAIVKIKQLNDSSFKDNVFYPENLFNN